MEFYYPNWNNDMWRIVGYLFFNDKEYFVEKTKKLSAKTGWQASCKKKASHCSIRLPPSAVCKTMPRTNSWRWCSLRIFQPCYTSCHSVKPLSLPAKRLPTPFVHNFPLKNPKWVILRSSYSKTSPCVSTGCPLHRELIHWLWKKKPPHIALCIRTYKCCKQLSV